MARGANEEIYMGLDCKKGQGCLRLLQDSTYLVEALLKGAYEITLKALDQLKLKPGCWNCEGGVYLV